MLAKSNLLANISALAAARADFERAHEFAEQAIEVCEKYRLTFAHGFCLIRRGRAEVGLKRFDQVEDTLLEVEPLVARSEDPYLDIELSLLKNRFEIGGDQWAVIGPLQTARSHQLPAGALAEHVALAGLAEVARGDTERGLAYSRQAAEMTRSTLVRWLVAFAPPIAESRGDQDETRISEQTARIVRDVAEAECLEAFVIAYRAYPPLLKHVASDPESHQTAIAVLAQARDLSLGYSFGIQGPRRIRLGRDAGLTPRELEVMELLAQGLPNSAIAERLFISVSTTKVHIHRILSKLGAKSRLHAVVRWNEIREDTRSA